MKRRARVTTTDIPTTPIRECNCMRVQHVHGTLAGYMTCKCHCTQCGAARSRYQASIRPTAKASASAAAADERTRGMWLSTLPDVDDATARAAALTVTSRIDDTAVAAELLTMLGLTPILTGSIP